MQSLGRLLNDDGTPNEQVIRNCDPFLSQLLSVVCPVARSLAHCFRSCRLFRKIDMDESRSLSRAELHALIVGINFEEGMRKWLDEVRLSVPVGGAFSSKFIHEYHERTRQEHDELVNRSDEPVESVENPRWCIAKAVALLLLGSAAVAAFADLLVDTVVSAIIFASRKKQRTCSLTFSEVYGCVTMNNTLCLGVLLALIYFRNLTWDFSSEVLIILLVCVVTTLFTSFWTTFPLCSIS
uniref:EF-hand domain-containing protein n=1 Tax=Zea mays TaxID=4577 RepID=A0A804MS78_MAIZE